MRDYGLLEVAAGLSALLVGPLLSVYDRMGPWLHASFSQMPVALVAFKLLLALAALFLPSFFLGGTVPVLAQALVSGRGQFGAVGSGLYAANTLGAAVGALSVPVLLAAKNGADASYAMCVGLNLLVGATAWLFNRELRQLGHRRTIPSAPAQVTATKTGTRSRRSATGCPRRILRRADVHPASRLDAHVRTGA